eukprot:9257433-Karenia_brevis.AAC.1
MLLFSDAPNKLDKPETYASFPNLDAIVKDFIHVPLKVELICGDKKSLLSIRLRRLMNKFAIAHDDGKEYFRAG